MNLSPLAIFDRIEVSEANALLRSWGHYLGACDRPFGLEAYALGTRAGGWVALAVSASTVSATAGGYDRQEAVELARLVRHPDHPWATLPCLRLWCHLGAPAWPHWPVRVALSYSSIRRHGRNGGKIYQLAGWRKIGETKGSSGGGTWSKRVSEDAGGPKLLWAYDLAAERAFGA